MVRSLADALADLKGEMDKKAARTAPSGPHGGVCPPPMVQSDELACRACGRRWGRQEPKPDCEWSAKL